MKLYFTCKTFPWNNKIKLNKTSLNYVTEVNISQDNKTQMVVSANNVIVFGMNQKELNLCVIPLTAIKAKV